MNQKLANVLIVGASVVGGATIGTLAGKAVMQKAPQFQPLLIWSSGALVGVGVTMLATPKLVTKSQAASVLASD